MTDKNNSETYSSITRGTSGVLVTVACFSTTFAKIRSDFLYLYQR
jgi:hypothetical protein